MVIHSKDHITKYLKPLYKKQALQYNNYRCNLLDDLTIEPCLHFVSLSATNVSWIAKILFLNSCMLRNHDI